MDKGRLTKRIIGVACILIALVLVAVFGYRYYLKHNASQVMENLSEKAVETTPKSEPEVFKEPESVIAPLIVNWDVLYEQNEDIYAWLYVPGTNVDYPVLQHPSDDSYYLMHNLDGSEGYPGCIYTEKTYNSTDFTDANTVLYGHNMKNGSMFSTIHRFEDRDFFEENQYIFVYTPEKNYAFKVFSALQIDDRHILDGWDFTLESALLDYENALFEIGRGHRRAGETFADDDRLITLSTCVSSSEDTSRFIVQGKLVEEKEN